MNNSDGRIVCGPTHTTRRGRGGRARQREDTLRDHFVSLGVTAQNFPEAMKAAKREHASAVANRDRLKQIHLRESVEATRQSIREAYREALRTLRRAQRSIDELEIYGRHLAKNRARRARELAEKHGPSSPATHAAMEWSKRTNNGQNGSAADWAEWRKLVPRVRAEQEAKAAWRQDRPIPEATTQPTSARTAPAPRVTRARTRSRRPRASRRATPQATPSTGDSSPGSDGPGSPEPDEPDPSLRISTSKIIEQLRRGVPQKDIRKKCQRVTRVGVERATTELLKNVLGRLLCELAPTDHTPGLRVVACWAPQAVASALEQYVSSSPCVLPDGSVGRVDVDVSHPLDLDGRALCVLVGLTSRPVATRATKRPPAIVLPTKQRRNSAKGGAA